MSLRTPALCFSVDEKHFENATFRKRFSKWLFTRVKTFPLLIFVLKRCVLKFIRSIADEKYDFMRPVRIASFCNLSGVMRSRPEFFNVFWQSRF